MSTFHILGPVLFIPFSQCKLPFYFPPSQPPFLTPAELWLDIDLMGSPVPELT